MLEHSNSINVTSFTNNPDITNHLNSCGASEAAHKTIGRICRQLGKLNGANYMPGFTGANIIVARRAFCSLLPNNYVSAIDSLKSTDCESIYNYIASHKVVTLFAGYDSPDKAIRRGHVWVCDGGKRIRVTQQVALAGGGTETVELSRKTYFSFNWGWRGSYNGYFFAGVFDPHNNTTNGDGAYKYDVIYFHVQK